MQTVTDRVHAKSFGDRIRVKQLQTYNLYGCNSCKTVTDVIHVKLLRNIHQRTYKSLEKQICHTHFIT